MLLKVRLQIVRWFMVFVAFAKIKEIKNNKKNFIKLTILIIKSISIIQKITFNNLVG